MGNQQIKDFFNNSENLQKGSQYLTNFYNAELLNHGHFLSDKWIQLNIEKQKDSTSFFDWNNVQQQNIPAEQMLEKIKLQEFKENLLIGMLPKSSTNDLLNPALFDEIQFNFSPSNVVQFRDHQNQKFLVLNHLFQLIQGKRKSDSSTLMQLKQAVNAYDVPKAAEVGIRSGIHLLISLLREASQTNQGLRDDTLNFLIELFTEVKPLSLWGNKKIDVILDKSLHTVADYLEELILSEKTSQDGKSKALKVLFSMGLLRGSLPNLLSVVDLLRKGDLHLDLGNEIYLFKEAKADTSLHFEDNLWANSKVFFKSSLKNDDKPSEKQPHVSITTDGRFVYLHSEIEGLMKIGTGFKYTMLGKIYEHKENYRLKEKGSLAYIQGKLFYRSAKIAPLPIIEIDLETLEEIPDSNIIYDNQAPNCLFAEQTNPEIEFPHPQIDQESQKQFFKQKTEQNQLQQAKQNESPSKHQTNQQNRTTIGGSQKRDLRLLRPSQRSPMFSEGRYLYIISQWTVESRGRTNEDEEDEEDNQQTAEGEVKPAKFGIDIYDPLQNFEHVRCVELVDSNQNLNTKEKKNRKNIINIKNLDSASFATNGSQLVMGVSAGTSEPAELHYNYFDLKDGKYIKTEQNLDSSYYGILCYDYDNNVVWGVNASKKTFDSISCYINQTVPERFQYSEDLDEHQPYENERIVELALDGLGFSIEDDQLEKKKEEAEKLKDDWQVLLSLGFYSKDQPEELFKKEAALLLQNKDQGEQQNKAMQLFILANIARLADSYANLEKLQTQKLAIENQVLQDFRKPYCVNLIPKVFFYLEKFIDRYSQAFQDPAKEDDLYDQSSFLCTLRIIKYNLHSTEKFQEQLNKMKISLPNNQFCVKLSKVITMILESTPSENRDFEEIRKNIYSEALQILQYNLSIIYPQMTEILEILNKNIKNIESQKLNRDIVLSILGWLSQKRHVRDLVGQLISKSIESEPDALSEHIYTLVNFIVNYEVKKFTEYVNSLENYEQFPIYKLYKEDLCIIQGNAFLIEFQREILYQIGQNTQEKTLELKPIIALASKLTEWITTNASKINDCLEKKIKDFAIKIEEGEKLKFLQAQADEALKKKKEKKQKSLEELINDANGKCWEKLTQIFIDKVYFSQVISQQINSMCLLSSNFIIAAKILKCVSSYLQSLNKLYRTRKELHSSNLEKISTFYKEKSEVFESEHPPAVKSTKKQAIHIQGAKCLRVVFDPQCDLRRNCDYLQFWADDKQKDKITERMDKSGDDSSFPKNDLIIQGDTFYYYFYSDNCRNQQWGYKFTVYASIMDNVEKDWMAGFHRTCCWLASKCAAQLVNGSALMQALMQDEEQKYNALLNSKLFSGGMEKCYFSGGKEAVWLHLADIINEFQAGHLSEYLSSEITPEEQQEESLLLEIMNGGQSDKRVKRVTDHIQKLFSKECLWANLGGENGDKLVRAAFSVVIKHAGLSKDFQDAVQNVDQFVTENQKSNPLLKNFIKKWHQCSRMRTWLVEKRKDIDDMAERNRQQAVLGAQKAQEEMRRKKKEQEEEMALKKNISGKKKHTKRKNKGKNQKEEEEYKGEPTGPSLQVEQQSIEQLQIKDTDEIIQRMIDQIVKKSQFLIQLIPSQHWSQDIERKDKQLLFRSSSQVEHLQNKEEEWKRKLLQWKHVRQSKAVHKSLEDEANEIHLSLTTSVLLCLQSPVSIRRLKKQVESAYLRAICRTIGLNALTQIVQHTPGSLFRQDVVGWLCSALRGSENKLYHFTDNLQGCGYFLEGAVNTSFKNVIQALVRAMSTSNNAQEIKCLLEALKWKYHGDDHSFLSEIDLFGILRGKDSHSLLRRAWGKSFDNSLKTVLTMIKKNEGLEVDQSLVKKLLELFEIIVILCVGKLHDQARESNQTKIQDVGKKVAALALEKHISAVDEYASEILIKQAFSVIFTELENADECYRNFQGMDWGAWLRAKQRQELKEEMRAKKKKKVEKKSSNQGNEWGEEQYNDIMYGEEGMSRSEESISQEQSQIRENENNDEEENKDIDDFEGMDIQPYEQIAFDNNLEEQKVEMEIEEETKTNNNTKEDNEGDKKEKEKKLKKERIKELIEMEEKLLYEQMQSLYNPEFLFRLLSLVYRCITVSLDQVCIVVGNPTYLKILFNLLKSAPPPHRILILKIFSQLFATLPEEIFSDSLIQLKYEKNPSLKGSLVLNYFTDLLMQIRKQTFNDSIDFPEDYTVSSELVQTLRTLLQLPNWQSAFREFIDNELLSSEDIEKQNIGLSILGGEFNGLRYGGDVIICSTQPEELFDDNVLLKNLKGEEQSHETATIMGFSEDYCEKISEEEKKKLKPGEDPRFHIQHSIGSIKHSNNPVVLIHSAIAKQISNYNAFELISTYRFNTVAIDNQPFKASQFNFQNQNLIKLFKWAIHPNQTNVAESRAVHCKALAIKCLYQFTQEESTVKCIVDAHSEIFEHLMNLASQKVITHNNLMNLEMTEEKMYRLLKEGTETGNLNLLDLKPMSATIKMNELEILLGKEFQNLKIPIVSGYNIEKINQFYEILSEQQLLDQLKDEQNQNEKFLQEFLKEKALLIDNESLKQIQNQYSCIGSYCKLLITFNFDMKGLQQQIEGSGNQQNQDVKKQKKQKSQSKRNSQIQSMLLKQIPYSIVNISEKYFDDLIKEYENQRKKEYLNVYEEKLLIDELVEFGFPKDICDQYFSENPKVNLEIAINEISKLIEQQDEDDQKQNIENKNNQERQKKQKTNDEDDYSNESYEDDVEGSFNEKEEQKAQDEESLKDKNEVKDNDELSVKDQESQIEEDQENQDNQASEEIEKEDPNICFKCKGEKEQMQITDEKNRFYDSVVDFEGMNQIGKIILFKQTNYNLAIYYARRAVLSILENWPSNQPNSLLQDKSKILKFIKLVCFESIFSSSTMCNNDLIYRVQKLLQKYFQQYEKNEIATLFIDKLFEECVERPLQQLEAEYLGQTKQMVVNKQCEKKKTESNKKIQYYTGKINTEGEIENPFLEFSLILADMMINSEFISVQRKLFRIDLLNIILGLITVVRQNKSLGWGLMVFSMKYIEFLNNKLQENIKLSFPLKNVFADQNVKNLHNFLHEVKLKEKSDAFSRRTQIITELLLFLNKFQKNLEKQAAYVTKENDLGIDLEKFQFIENMTGVVEMMENYQENKILIASTWLQISSDLIKKEQKVIDGDHFYFKNIHTFKLNLPYSAEAQIKFSDESQTDIGDSILLSADPNGECSLQKYTGNLSKKPGLFPSGSFYVHFPIKGSDIYSFGVNNNNQLGSGESSNNGPLTLENFSTTNVKLLDSGDQHTIILNNQGELWTCGSGNQTGIVQGSQKGLNQVTGLKEKIINFSCGSNFTIFLTENNVLWGVGSNVEGRCGLNWNQGSASPQKIEFPSSKIIKQISCGGNHSMILTNDGQVYVTGNNELGQLGLQDENGNKMANQNLFRQISDLVPSKKKVVQVVAGNCFSLLLMEDQNKKTSVMSCGEKANGKLGLGEDSAAQVNVFTIIPELDKIGIKEIFTQKKHSFALTKSGKVYSWGLNDFGQLGHGNTEKCFTPKLVQYFVERDLKVINLGCGNTHSIFIVKSKSNPEKGAYVYACGENISNKLCLKTGKEKITLPTLVEFFEEKNAKKVICGQNSSFIMTENLKIPKFRDQHHNHSCTICKSNPISGSMLISQDHNSNEFYCLNCISQQNKRQQPKLLLLCKEAINAPLKDFKWPKIETNCAELLENYKENLEFPNTICRNCLISPIKNVLYFSVHEKPFSDTVCENCIEKIFENQVSPTLYYRITCLPKQHTQLPQYSRQYFFNHSDTYGFQMTISPKFNEQGYDYMIEKYQESYECFSNDFRNIKPEADEQLVDMINNIAQKKEKTVFELEENLTFPKEEINIRSGIENLSQDFLRKRFLILKRFNQMIKEILPYIDFSAKKQSNRLRNIYSTSSCYIFWDVKSQQFDQVLAQDAKASTNAKIKVNRMKANKQIQKGKCDYTGEFTVFGQIFQYYKSQGFEGFRVQKDQNPFSVQFVGEASIDVGGPYREAISQMCSELESPALPLFIPSPNQKNDSGQFREKWVLNPSANTLINMKMYEFLGAIFGCSIRTKNFLNLDLPSIIWKMLVDQPVTRKDLEYVDRYTVQCLDEVINIEKRGVDEKNFNDYIQEKFVTYLSDGSEVELFPNGKNCLVTFEKRQEYASLVEKVRINECKKQADALRRGLSLVVPDGILNLLTWRELETLVCGKPILDIDLLKQNTIYRGCSESDSVIEYFWRALTEFSPEERSMYLRFVWGRSRLPLTSKDFPMKHQVEILRQSGPDPDIMLPVAHTCFFQIEIPKYSTYEILRDKLKYAITHCQAIDTDGRAYDIWEDED